MVAEFEILIEILEISVQKNGKDKPLTIGHLLNIAKLAKRVHAKREDEDFKSISSYEDELWNDMHKYGTND